MGFKISAFSCPSMIITVNHKDYDVDVDSSMPLLWVIRDIVGLTGTKFGCGIGQCGACVVHVDGRAVNSCQISASQVAGRKITTIEGLASDIGKRIQKAWIDEGVVQCGYCQSGQIMVAAALLNDIPLPTDVDIDRAMSRNICRCGTYQRIRKAIHVAAKLNDSVK